MIELLQDNATTWSKEERGYARHILSLPLPSNEVRDQALAATPPDYPFCYYSRSRPLQSGMLHLEYIGEHTVEGVNRRWLYTCQLLSLTQLYSLELTPIDTHAIAFILIPYIARLYNSQAIALAKREPVPDIIQIEPESGGQWRMISIDEDGIAFAVEHRDDRNQAILDAICAHYTVPTPIGYRL